MAMKVTVRYFLAVLAVGVLMSAALPAAAAVPDVHPDESDPVMVAAPVDDHGERCCLPDLGGHGLCHATAALTDRGELPRGELADSVSTDPQVRLRSRRAPPLLEPPILSA